jgi:uncharacterized protein (DUF488 family)
LPMPKLFTIGYEKRSLAGFLNILKQNGIQALVDIRENPYSKNKDFSRKELGGHLQAEGIEYLHLVSFGSPKWLREQIHKTGDYRYFFEQYNIYLAGKTYDLTNLRNLICDKSICLMCLEQNLAECHRLAVANKMAELIPDLKIIHL